MWKTITWDINDKVAAYAWLEANASKYHIQEIAVNNGYGFIYKPLREM